MTERPPEVGLGDLLRAVGALGPDPDGLDAIRRLLGLGAVVQALQAAPAPGPDVLRPAGARSPVASPRPPVGQDVEADGDVRAAGITPLGPSRTVVVTTTPARPTPPRPVPIAVETLFPAPIGPRSRAQPEPLFSPHHERAVLSALTGVNRAGRELDVEAVVDRVSRREVLENAPRLAERTTTMGVRLIRDQSPSMAPFDRDLYLLTLSLRRAIGHDGVEVLDADGRLSEAQAAESPEDTDPVDLFDAGPEPAPPPARGRPILLASDLGLGTASAGGYLRTPDEVLALAESSRAAGCPFVVLIPYPPDRWPVWARTRLVLVHWDRPTIAGQALRAARRAAARL